jgi:activator of Hsp90 ATPase-like protein
MGEEIGMNSTTASTIAVKSSEVIRITVEVALNPMIAFAVFTEEIGRWWRPGPINWNNSKRAIGTRMEAKVGGSWIEIYDEATGEGFEQGKITVWEPGSRLAFLYRDAGKALDGTEVEVRFEAIDDGTRVTLEHRGWDKLPADVVQQMRPLKRWGWSNVLNWYSEWAFWGTPRRVKKQ